MATEQGKFQRVRDGFGEVMNTVTTYHVFLLRDFAHLAQENKIAIEEPLQDDASLEEIIKFDIFCFLFVEELAREAKRQEAAQQLELATVLAGHCASLIMLQDEVIAPQIRSQLPI